MEISEIYEKETGERHMFFSGIGQKLYSTEYIKWLEKKSGTNTSKIEMAEQQILGFHSARNGETWDSLVSSMGLTMDEYNQLEDEDMICYLTDYEKEAIRESVFK